MKFLSKNLVKNNYYFAVVLVVLVLAAYWPMLKGPFKALDEQNFIVQNPEIHNLQTIHKAFLEPFYFSSYYRPLISVIYALEYHFFALNPFYYHVVSLGLHVLISWIIFLLISSLMNDRSIGVAVALLFAIHPIQWEVVSSIACYSNEFCSFFYILSFWLFHKFRTHKTSKAVYAFSLTAFLLAILCRESAALFPLLLISYVLILERKEAKSLKSSWMVVVPYFVITFLFLLFRSQFLHFDLPHWASAKELILGVGTFLRATLTYLRLFILPVDLYYDRGTALFTDWTQVGFLLSVLFFLTLIVVVFKFRKRMPPAALFFISWFFIGLLPVSQIVPIKIQPGFILTSEDYLYLPSLGVFVLLILFFRRLKKWGTQRGLISKTTFRFMALVFFLFLFLATVEQNIYAGNEIALLKRSLHFNPQNIRVRVSLGLAYIHKGSFELAEVCFRQALQIDPKNLNARLNLGRTLHYEGRYLEALKEYEKIKDSGISFALLEKNISEARQSLNSGK